VGLFCHHRSGSTWLSDLLEEICQHTGHRFARVFDSHMVGGDLAVFVQSEGVEVLAYMNADWHEVAALGELRGVHVVRDPRDVLVSAYYAHRFSHPTSYWSGLAQHREELEALPLHEGLLAEVQCRRLQFQQMADWNYAARGVLELRFEDLVEEPAVQLSHALAHMGLLSAGLGEAEPAGQEPAPASGLKGLALSALGRVRGGSDAGDARRILDYPGLSAILERHSFEVLSGGRARGEADAMHHYRRGTPGEWREVLAPAHLAALDEEFPGLISLMGYSD
jgi:hypothetical protein